MPESKVKCRRCGGEYMSNQLKLDGVYGMVVCPDCIRGRKAKEEVQKKRIEEKAKQEANPEPPKPAGWDNEDVLLDKLIKQKEARKTVTFTAPGKVKCRKCAYVFKYDAFSNTPTACPYCGLLVRVK